MLSIRFPIRYPKEYMQPCRKGRTVMKTIVHVGIKMNLRTGGRGRKRVVGRGVKDETEVEFEFELASEEDELERNRFETRRPVKTSFDSTASHSSSSLLNPPEIAKQGSETEAFIHPNIQWLRLIF